MNIEAGLFVRLKIDHGNHLPVLPPTAGGGYNAALYYPDPKLRGRPPRLSPCLIAEWTPATRQAVIFPFTTDRNYAAGPDWVPVGLASAKLHASQPEPLLADEPRSRPCYLQFSKPLLVTLTEDDEDRDGALTVRREYIGSLL